jgi:hypothetical protein
LGNVLWQKVLSRHKRGSVIGFHDPVYTRTGTILFHPRYDLTAGVMEITQNGDSLTIRNLSPVPTQTSYFQVLVRGSLLPLRDGGYAVLGQVDSAATGYYRPFLTRLDASLNVVWTSMYRPQATKQYTFSHPYELADGSIVVLARNNNSGRQEPYWLFRYSASGSLQQRYAFASALLPALTNAAANATAFFDDPVGLQPLSDSTFVLVNNVTQYVNNVRIQALYLAHLKVPGLRRVIDSHYIPATNSPLAVRATSLAFPAPAYPNPAREIVTVPLPASRAAGQLVLTDLAGRRVLAWPVASGATSATLPVRGVAAGLYLLRLEVPGQPPGTQRLAIEQ